MKNKIKESDIALVVGNVIEDKYKLLLDDNNVQKNEFIKNCIANKIFEALSQKNSNKGDINNKILKTVNEVIAIDITNLFLSIKKMEEYKDYAKKIENRYSAKNISTAIFNALYENKVLK